MGSRNDYSLLSVSGGHDGSDKGHSSQSKPKYNEEDQQEKILFEKLKAIYGEDNISALAITRVKGTEVLTIRVDVPWDLDPRRMGGEIVKTNADIENNPINRRNRLNRWIISPSALTSDVQQELGIKEEEPIVTRSRFVAATIKHQGFHR